eukprot:3278152-Prymnesium_polylepis.1
MSVGSCSWSTCNASIYPLGAGRHGARTARARARRTGARRSAGDNGQRNSQGNQRLRQRNSNANQSAIGSLAARARSGRGWRCIHIALPIHGLESPGHAIPERNMQQPSSLGLARDLPSLPAPRNQTHPRITRRPVLQCTLGGHAQPSRHPAAADMSEARHGLRAPHRYSSRRSSDEAQLESSVPATIHPRRIVSVRAAGCRPPCGWRAPATCGSLVAATRCSSPTPSRAVDSIRRAAGRRGRADARPSASKGSGRRAHRYCRPRPTQRIRARPHKRRSSASPRATAAAHLRSSRTAGGHHCPASRALTARARDPSPRHSRSVKIVPTAGRHRAAPPCPGRAEGVVASRPAAEGAAAPCRGRSRLPAKLAAAADRGSSAPAPAAAEASAQ